MINFLEDDIIYAEPSFSGAFDNSELLIDWAIKNIAFGLISLKSKDGQFIIDSEYMSREFVKKMICRAIDKAIFKDDVSGEMDWI
jgi:hypothetical protein